MTWKHPDDVPTSLTRRAYALRGIALSQNAYAAVVADAYEDVKAEVLRDIAERAKSARTMPKESRWDRATEAAGERLGLPWETVADVLDVYAAEASLNILAARVSRMPRDPDVCVLTRSNADQVAQWVGGWRCGGARELVGWGRRGAVTYAGPGDSIRRHNDGRFTVEKRQD